jgi:LPXTG-motif cell wall-anchored protein
MDDGDALQGDVETAVDALMNAILAQRYKADKSILEDLIGKAEGIDLTGYTAESVAVFRSALATAQSVLADETLSEDDQATVDNAVAALSAAMDGLTAGGAPETTDKPEASEKPQTTDKPQTTEKPENVPQTGDSAQLMVYVAALAGSVSLLTGAAYVTRKRRS